MKKALMVLWNNINILLCGICGGYAMVEKDWWAGLGWMLAAVAWYHSNLQGQCLEECVAINKKAIALLELMKCRRTEVRKVDDGEQVDTEGGCE